MKRFFALLAALVLTAAMVSGCSGGKLPQGVEEEQLLSAGRELLLLLLSGEYDQVHDALREDVAQSVTSEDIRAIVLQETEDMGIYKQIDKSMVTSQTVQGEELALAVFSCEFEEGKVFCRLAFDRDLTLVGISLQKQ